MKRFPEGSLHDYNDETYELPLSQPKRLLCESASESFLCGSSPANQSAASCNTNPLDISPTDHVTETCSFKAITAMVDQCSHWELVQLHETIKPKLKRDFFALLPAELVFRILSYLSLSDVLHCAQVSRLWYQATNDPLLWFRLYCRTQITEPLNDRTQLLVVPTGHISSISGGCVPQPIFHLNPKDLPVVANSVPSTEVSWKALCRTALETECNWRNGSPWSPVILPAHHNHVITCLEVYNDWAITGSDDASICIWDLITSRLLISLFGHLGGVWSLAVLPPLPQSSGKDPDDLIRQTPLLVSGSCDRSARVWLMDGLKWPCITTLYGHQSTVRCVAGQEGDLFTKQSTVLKTVHEADEQKNDSEEQWNSSEMELKLEGIRLAVTGSRDTTLRLWDVRTGQCLQLFQGHLGAVRCVQFFGHVIVSGSYDCTIRLWSALTGTCLRVLHGHRNRVYTLLFDGSHIISASLDTTIRVWNGLTGRLEHTFYGHQSLTSEMAYAATQRTLVSSNADETIRVWDVASGECMHVLAGPYKHHSAVTCVQLSRNFIISSSNDGTVKLWDRRTGAYIRDLVHLEGAGRGAVIWRIVASEKRLVCAAGSRSGIENTKLIILRFEEPITDPIACSTSHTCHPKTQPIPVPNPSHFAESHVYLSDDSLSESLTI